MESFGLALGHPNFETLHTVALPSTYEWRCLTWSWAFQSVKQRITLCSSRGLLLEVVDLALRLPKGETLLNHDLQEGLLEVFDLGLSLQHARHTLVLFPPTRFLRLSLGLWISNMRNTLPAYSPRGTLWPVFGPSRKRPLTFDLPEGSCWRCLAWPKCSQHGNGISPLLSQKGLAIYV